MGQIKVKNNYKLDSKYFTQGLEFVNSTHLILS